MSLEKENKVSGCRYLLIFGRNTCLRRRLPDLSEGRWDVFLNREDTGFLSDERIVFEICQGNWQVDGKLLSARSPVCFYTEEKEKILFLLSEKVEFLKPAGRLWVKAGESIRIGNAYTNPVFYECFSQMEAVHAEIICKEQGSLYINTGQEGVYVNEKAHTGQKRLGMGDRIDLYGLHLLVLEDLIAGVSFCGICRIAECRNPPEKINSSAGGIKEYGNIIQRGYAQEEALHTGEVEVILPDKPALPPKQPLFLSLGPALTMVLPMLLMAQLGGRYMGGMGSGFYYMSVIMSGCTAFLTIFWGLVNHEYSKWIKKREERDKERLYRDYLKGIEDELLNCQNENRRILEQRYPSIEKLFPAGKETAAVHWNRYYRQKDFLFFRLGVGGMDFQMQVKLSGGNRGILPDKLSKEAEEMAKRFASLPEIPVGVDLFKNRQIGLIEGKKQGENRQGNIGWESSRKEVLFQLLMQIMIFHCYTEVKIACFYRKERTMDREVAECLKWAPHCWSADRRVRFLAGCEQEAAEILPSLTRELVKGAARERESVAIPWYVIVVLDEELIAGEAIYQYLTDSGTFYPASAVFAGTQREALPKSCRYFLAGQKQEGEIINLSNDQLVRQHLFLEICSFSKAQKYVRGITGLRVRESEGDGQIPERVEFLKLYGCSRILELDSGRRWRLARPEERLKAPVGCRAGGNLVSLDVHEKFHGPHGLVAGTTGSGKSELLQTYLLSMAISYSPEDINFFMIDYKGGGTGNSLKELPHCAGVISNLSGKQIRRAMSAISSENKRRQKLLGEFQVNHIDAYCRLYREGKADRPMPHLILVVDEFAELKKEEPEFMQEIISLAQVGRSLGVHLILATQKPAGTVDDKIWSNARFRLCLKVQDKQDSMDMLKNGDAAALTIPGQCYIQIGNQEYYELFQTGYCGGSYQEGGKEKAKAALLSATGRRQEREQKNEPSKTRALVQVLVDYVNQITEQFHYQPADQLWLPELPDTVALEELTEKKKEMHIQEPCAVIGLCDDPEMQRQFVLTYQPLLQGHLIICGGPGTGKTTLLQTILWQLCKEYTPGQAQVLIVSLWQESFTCFRDMPGCLGILRDRENMKVFFYHLKELVNSRRKQLSGIGCQQYNRRGDSCLPYLFLVIDNFGSFGKELEEGQEEFILKLAAEGISLGIYLVFSASALNEVGGRLFEKIKTTVALEMSDRFQYGDVLRQYYLPALPEENKQGRGLCKVQGNVLEFQGALALGAAKESERIRLIAEAGRRKEEELRKGKLQAPDKFPFLPEKPELHILARDHKWDGERFPIGYCLDTGSVRTISPKESACFLILGNERTGRSVFLSCIIEGFLQMGGQAILIDQDGRMDYFEGRDGVVYLTTEEALDSWQRNAALPGRGEGGDNCIRGVFVSNLGSFCHFIYRSGERKEERVDFWEELIRKKKNYFFAGICHPLRDVEAAGTVFFREAAAGQHGICLGGNVASQRVFAFDDLNYAAQNQYQPPGIGYLKEGPGSRTGKLLLPMYQPVRSGSCDKKGFRMEEK